MPGTNFARAECLLLGQFWPRRQIFISQLAADLDWRAAITRRAAPVRARFFQRGAQENPPGRHRGPGLPHECLLAVCCRSHRLQDLRGLSLQLRFDECQPLFQAFGAQLESDGIINATGEDRCHSRRQENQSCFRFHTSLDGTCGKKLRAAARNPQGNFSRRLALARLPSAR